jgi:Rho-binding antiterminator
VAGSSVCGELAVCRTGGRATPFNTAKEFAMKEALTCDRACFSADVTNAVTADMSSYHPISCEFHDLLEVNATVRKPVQIRFRDEEGVLQIRSAVISDVYARKGIEFLTTSTGETMRLDRLVEVDGAKLADF